MLHLKSPELWPSSSFRRGLSFEPWETPTEGGPEKLEDKRKNELGA